MLSKDEVVELTRRELEEFCHEFLEHPYLCYTEHSHHARFAARLYHALPENERYQQVGQFRMCRVQKEYPTNRDLSKSRRQHWDVSVVERVTTLPARKRPYDHLPLAAAVEFGLNEKLSHLEDDIKRLSHADSNVHQGFSVHLFRLSEHRIRPSARDCSPNAKRLRAAVAIQPLLAGTNVKVYLGVFDPSKRNGNGLWRITATELKALTRSHPEEATIPDVQTADTPLVS